MDRQWNGLPVAPPQHTRFASRWTINFLYFAFHSRFEKLTIASCPRLESKTPSLWEKEDVVEIFIAPDATRPHCYKEFELSPSSQWIDIDIDHSRGRKDFAWRSGMESRSRVETSMKTWRAEFRIPLGALGMKELNDGVTAALNAFRVELASTLYLAWNPTLTAAPNFHVPDRFGEMVFRK